MGRSVWSSGLVGLVLIVAGCGGGGDRSVRAGSSSTTTDGTRGIVSVPAVPLPSTPPPRDGGAAASEVFAAAPGEVRSNGLGAGGWTIDLRPGREPLAEEIHARYGDTLGITIAGRPWPDATDATPEPCTGMAPIEGNELDGAGATLAPERSTVPVGAEVTGTLTVWNRTDHPITFTSGGVGVNAVLLDAAGKLVGYFDGAQTMEAQVHTVEPGKTSEPVHFLAGIASCDPASGSAVQPGTYRLTAQLRIGEQDTIDADPVSVTIVRP